jgi:hypothetical protein
MISKTRRRSRDSVALLRQLPLRRKIAAAQSREPLAPDAFRLCCDAGRSGFEQSAQQK